MKKLSLLLLLVALMLPLGGCGAMLVGGLTGAAIGYSAAQPHCWYYDHRRQVYYRGYC
jgi:hypothetical protein